MSKWCQCAPYQARFANKSVRIATRFRAACLGLATLLSTGTQAARSDEAAKVREASEASVLVATREVSPPESSPTDQAEASDDGELEPVAQCSDIAPDMAAANDEDGQAHQIEPQDISSVQPQETALKATRRMPAVQATPLEPVKFQEILVGKSSKQQLLEEWGDPADAVATAEGSVLAYDIEPFQAVEVLVSEGDVVSAIKIALAEPLDPTQLAEQLSLNDIRTVTARDDADHPLGLAFPERGVIFMYADSAADALAGDGELANAVSHVVLQQLDPLAFAMRAENGLHGEYVRNIKDLKTATRLDPQCAPAHALLARIYLATGQADLADEEARTACEIDPENTSYQLLRGRTRELQCEYDDAVLTVRAVLDRAELAPLDKAQALHQMGYLASLGDMEIASKAISFHTRAIEAADALATSTNAKERRAAKQILVEAHLAIAEEVARQAFNQKIDNLSLWVGRASGIAEEYIGHDEGSIELRLLIAQRALAALASFRPTLDPAPWIEEADEAAQELFAYSDDELWQARVKWELGLAYLHALRVEHVRRETQNALEYGNKAVEYLAQGAKTRQAVHSSEQLIGQLYFQLGAVQAVHQLDHKKAAKWYDKAEPLLVGPLPKSELFAPRREGEMLVSMGVTYWQIGEKNRAVTLTQTGVSLVEAAVKAGILARTTLAVPYGNLATMYQQLGESSNAAKYSKLAKSVAGHSAPARVSQMPGIRQTSGSPRNDGPVLRPSARR